MSGGTTVYKALLSRPSIPWNSKMEIVTTIKHLNILFKHVTLMVDLFKRLSRC